MGPLCILMCRSECYEKINYIDLNSIFDAYWELGYHTRQWDFIAQHIKVINKKQQIANSSETRRNFSRQYTLTINYNEFQVCKNMFQ